MATYTGQFGVIKTAANTIGEVKNFEVSTTADTADSTVQGDVWKKNVTLQNSWSGQLTAQWDNTDAGQTELALGAEVTLTLQPAGTDGTGVANQFTGDAIVTGITYPSDMAAMIDTNITFIGTGVLTQAVSS